MNLRFSFVLCSILIYGIISCSADDDGHECIGQYLKSKGLIEYEVSPNKKYSQCLSIVNAYVEHLHELFQNKTELEVPNDSNCLVEEFDKSGIVNVILKAGFFQSDATLSESEQKTFYEELDKKGNEELEKVGTKCGVDGKTLEKYMNEIFNTAFKDSSRENEAAKETA